MKAVVDEVLKQGSLALRDNSTLGGAPRKRDKKPAPKDDADKKKANGISSTDAKPAAAAGAAAPAPAAASSLSPAGSKENLEKEDAKKQEANGAKP